MKIIFNVALLCGILLSAGCYKKDQQPLEQATFETVCTDKYAPFYDERKYSRFHHVAFTGYLATPKSVMVSNTMSVYVYGKPNREGEKILASFRVGSRDNHVERLKSGYKESDMKIKSDTGAILGDGSKVTIEGDVSPGAIPGKPMDKPCLVSVDKVVAAN
jgi:hypothetical protein